MAVSLVSLISKKIIKPSIGTPHLRSHKLSFIDQVLHMSIPVAFFYPINKSYDQTHVDQLLHESLSKVPSLYYPYAGRLKDGSSVDCNDMGVEFTSVRVHCPMSDFLNHPYTDAEHVVFPVAWPYHHNEQNLAVIQVSYFDCGGIAVGGCLSHKIGDGYTASNFFYNWGVLSRDISATVPSPRFVKESIYPQSSDPSVLSTMKPEEPRFLGKRFVFPAAKLNALKAKLSSESGVQDPTRTEVVRARLYKCSVAASRAESASFKPSSLFQVANMRGRLKPPLSDDDASGNVMSGFFVRTTKERDLNCPRLIGETRNEKEKLLQEVTQNANISEVVDSVGKGKMPFHSDSGSDYVCTSLLSFPFYKMDFGCGLPARVSLATGPTSRYFHLLDDQSGGGVEDVVLLDEHKMYTFERDLELLEFAISVPHQ